MNTQATEMSVDKALGRVLRMQAKLHRWAVTDPGRRFDDVLAGRLAARTGRLDRKE